MAASSPAWSSWPSLGLDSGCFDLLDLGGATDPAEEAGWVKLGCCANFECLRAWKSLTSSRTSGGTLIMPRDPWLRFSDQASDLSSRSFCFPGIWT